MSYSAEIKVIFDQIHQNGGGFWSRADWDIHAQHGSSTIDTLEVLGELGATTKEYPVLLEVIEFVLTYQTSYGFFKYSKTSSKLPCMTARILGAFGKVGVSNNKRVEKNYQQLLDTQWLDGGWRCKTVKIGKSLQTDSSNLGTTLYVLDAFRFRYNDQKAVGKLNKSIDFLLKHWETRLALGPCDFGMGSRFFSNRVSFFTL